MLYCSKILAEEHILLDFLQSTHSQTDWHACDKERNQLYVLCQYDWRAVLHRRRKTLRDIRIAVRDIPARDKRVGGIRFAMCDPNKK